MPYAKVYPIFEALQNSVGLATSSLASPETRVPGQWMPTADIIHSGDNGALSPYSKLGYWILDIEVFKCIYY